MPTSFKLPPFFKGQVQKSHRKSSARKMLVYFQNVSLRTLRSKTSQRLLILLSPCLLLALIIWKNYQDSPPVCTNTEVFSQCGAGCDKRKVLYVGDTEDCRKPENVCCDQIGTAYCNSNGLCSCKPGYNAHVLNNFTLFKNTCFVAGGQPCHGGLGFFSVNRRKLYNFVQQKGPGVDISNSGSVLENKKYMAQENELRKFLKSRISEVGVFAALKGWGCESGICNKDTGICEYGVNKYFQS